MSYRVTAILFSCLSLTWNHSVASGEIDFNRDIRPILSDKCFFCHGPDAHERKADLRLDTEEGAQTDLGGYAAIVPGSSEESEFVARIIDVQDPMPPVDSHKELKPEEIELLTSWIEQGAEYAEPWAYVLPKKHPIPQITGDKWSENWIDHFLLARFEEENVEPAPDADRVTLLRRLYFDLTGLPPTPEEANAFVEDSRDLNEVVAETVSHLLESPHFGERLAIYWLDLVRYADTVGYHGDQDHRISPYRDYVIRALNQNMPFDQFTREQLAGDLLPESTKWQKVASGYNRLLQTSHEGGIQAKEYNAIYAADRVRNVSAVWMGATVGCAQCHDHKYDPYSIKDFYSMGAFFADIHDEGYNGNTLPCNRPPEMTFFDEEQEEKLAEIDGKLGSLLGEEDREQMVAFEAEKVKLENEAKTGKEKKKQEAARQKLIQLEEELAEAIPDDKRRAWEELIKQRNEIEKQGRETMIVVAKPPREMRILPRGNWQDDSGEVVSPAVPEFMTQISIKEGGRANRLDLANWLTDPEKGVGGLTGRVFANRFWYLFFGTGISRSLDDFGGQGEPPVHPELLDNLAVEFYEKGWDMKALIQLIVTSRAYRQSSVADAEMLDRDPYNQLFARQGRYRLPAELVRDNALFVSGLLVDEIGGESVKPYQPVGYYRHLNFPTRTYKQNDDKKQWRRGVYVHWQRMFLHPMMRAMDAPSREECTAQRPRSNTPTAALVLLNDPTFIEAARSFATRLLTETDDDPEARIILAFQLALSRVPDKEEIQSLTNLYQITRDEYLSFPEEAEKLVGVGLSSAPEGCDPVELASWTAVARAMLNLNEAVTRN